MPNKRPNPSTSSDPRTDHINLAAEKRSAIIDLKSYERYVKSAYTDRGKSIPPDTQKKLDNLTAIAENLKDDVERSKTSTINPSNNLRPTKRFRH